MSIHINTKRIFERYYKLKNFWNNRMEKAKKKKKWWKNVT